MSAPWVSLAAKCGIAKPNLSRLENDKVTPKFETIRALAAALDTHPALLVSAKDAWTWTQYVFAQWKLGLNWNGDDHDSRVELVRAVDGVKVFLTKWPEHRYARMKLLKVADHAPHDAELHKHTLDAEKWAREGEARRSGTKQVVASDAGSRGSP